MERPTMRRLAWLAGLADNAACELVAALKSHGGQGLPLDALARATQAVELLMELRVDCGLALSDASEVE